MADNHDGAQQVARMNTAACWSYRQRLWVGSGLPKSSRSNENGPMNPLRIRARLRVMKRWAVPIFGVPLLLYWGGGWSLGFGLFLCAVSVSVLWFCWHAMFTSHIMCACDLAATGNRNGRGLSQGP